jgi:hypothetical protein
MRLKESLTFHFDLSHCPQDVEFTLNAGDGNHYTLTRYSDAPDKLEEHRRQNRALALIPKSQLHRITHFVEGAELYGDRLSLRSVVYPSTTPDHPLPELALVFIHIPHEHRRAAYRHMRAKNVAPPHDMILDYYGVGVEALQAMNMEEKDEIRADAGTIKPPIDTARTIVFHHPEIGTTNTLIAQQIFDCKIHYTQEFRDLTSYIATHGSGSNTWYQKTYAKWQDPKTKEWVLAEADTGAVDKNGNKVQWPEVGGKAAIPLYDLTDEYTEYENPDDDADVMGMAAPVIQQALVAIKNDETLNGHLWTKQNGTTEKVETNVPPSLEVAAARRRRMGVGGATKGWTIKNQTSSYGLDVYPDELTYDYTNNTISFPVKNWPNRYLGAYVQFFKSDGTAINRKDIPGWSDDLPEFFRPMFETSPTKSFLTWLSPGNQVFGIPFPTNPVTLSFVWPKEATRAQVLLGGLGFASGFKDWDSEVDVLGVISTGVITYGVTAIFMALSIKVVNPWISSLSKDAQFGIYSIAAALGFEATVIGATTERETNTGKWLLSKLATMAASVVFGKFVRTGLNQVYQKEIEELVDGIWQQVTAEEALELIPVAGFALKAASVAADLAALTATTAECGFSPATYNLEILPTMDLNVTVKPDPRHGKQKQNPVWPMVSDHYVVSLTYPKAAGQDGGTTHTLTGPMPGDHAAPITVTFPNVPAGGQCNVTASIYSSNNWLAGQWTSGWINATPDPNDQLAVGGSITENLVPLTGTTNYSQKQRVIFDVTQGKHLWQVTQFSMDAALATDLDNKTVSQALRAAFQSNGNTLSPDNQVKISVESSGSRWNLVDSGTGITFTIVKVSIYSNDGKQYYELSVQNATNASPQLPAQLSDCSTGGDNHNICNRVNITINNNEYQLGYTWQASGQNLPMDDGTAPNNDQMFAFQSISTLGQPQDQIIQPSRGFALRAQLAFNQFGLTPLFYLPLNPYQAELDASGALPSDLAQAFSSYNLPQGAAITPIIKNQEWTIGVSGSDPLYDLRVVKADVNGQWQSVINVYSYPVPAIDNFWVDPRSPITDGPFHLRGVTFQPGQTTFDYSTTKSWGAFTAGNSLYAVLVHPHGYVVAIDYVNHKLFVLRLPANAVDEADAPLAMPLSGEGVREGLMKHPVAMTITADGRILVLEEGNSRIQAFDVKGNPVPSFRGPIRFTLPASFVSVLDSRAPNTALVQALQQSVTPSRAPLFSGNTSSVQALDSGKLDDALVESFHTYGYVLPEDTTKVTVLTTKAGSLWLLTDTVENTTYDVRLVTDNGNVQHLFVYYAFSLSIAVKSAGQEWTLADATNAMTFDVAKPAQGAGDLLVQQLVSTMALRDQSPINVSYLDVAVENKGYIYILAQATPPNGSLAIQLDIYNPDGTVLLDKPQTGVNAAKLTVDQWRTMFTMNYDQVLGPDGRTEPGISAWIPSTPNPPN